MSVPGSHPRERIPEQTPATTLREAGAQALHAYRGFIASRASRKPQPHELDPVIAGQALWEALKGFPKAAVSPYVIDKMRKCAYRDLGINMRFSIDSVGFTTLWESVRGIPKTAISACVADSKYVAQP